MWVIIVAGHLFTMPVTGQVYWTGLGPCQNMAGIVGGQCVQAASPPAGAAPLTPYEQCLFAQAAGSARCH